MSRSRKLPFAALLLLLSLFVSNVATASWDFSATAELQSRLFSQDARWPGQGGRDVQFSLSATAEARWRNAEGNQRMSFIPYARWDDTDSERSLFDLQEAYWAVESGEYELLIGANTVFWGVTESVHLVDIINQTDAVADIDGEDKLGQPMLNLVTQRDWGLLGLYVMPYFRERTFAGADGRFRTPLPVAVDQAEYESSADENHIDLALRYSHYIGDVDIGVSVFSGTSREPRLLLNVERTVLVPFYDQIQQVGVDLQYTREAWLWKLETIVREGASETFAAAVGGFEFTIYQVGDSAADIGLLLEYQYDGRGADEPLVTSDNDLFVGGRFALNDTQDTAVLAGIGRDIDTGEMFFNIEAERRIGEDYVVELRARAFSGAGPSDLTYTLANDDYVQLQLSRYF